MGVAGGGSSSSSLDGGGSGGGINGFSGSEVSVHHHQPAEFGSGCSSPPPRSVHWTFAYVMYHLLRRGGRFLVADIERQLEVVCRVLLLPRSRPAGGGGCGGGSGGGGGDSVAESGAGAGVGGGGGGGGGGDIVPSRDTAPAGHVHVPATTTTTTTTTTTMTTTTTATWDLLATSSCICRQYHQIACHGRLAEDKHEEYNVVGLVSLERFLYVKQYL